MSGLELYQALQETMEQAFADLAASRESGVAAAKKRAAARAALKTQMLALRTQGYPASMTQKVAEGCEGVNARLEEAECAEAAYKADLEAINLRKREADIIREQLNREWSDARRSV